MSTVFRFRQLRTLQRRIKRWRATEGPAREVYFPQQHVTGRLGQSDFTRMNELGITLGGQTFPHMLFHLVLTYSNWEAVTVCYSESFESLSEGLQNALWELGAVPLKHQIDRLSTAVNNMTEEKEFTLRYDGLMRHYRMQGRKIQAGHANENGDIEQRHHRLKRAVEQSLLLRGSRDFGALTECQEFLRLLLRRLNAWTVRQKASPQTSQVQCRRPIISPRPADELLVPQSSQTFMVAPRSLYGNAVFTQLSESTPFSAAVHLATRSTWTTWRNTSTWKRQHLLTGDEARVKL